MHPPYIELRSWDHGSFRASIIGSGGINFWDFQLLTNPSLSQHSWSGNGQSQSLVLIRLFKKKTWTLATSKSSTLFVSYLSKISWKRVERFHHNQSRGLRHLLEYQLLNDRLMLNLLGNSLDPPWFNSKRLPPPVLPLRRRCRRSPGARRVHPEAWQAPSTNIRPSVSWRGKGRSHQIRLLGGWNLRKSWLKRAEQTN